jgi:hypothetical protein
MKTQWHKATHRTFTAKAQTFKYKQSSTISLQQQKLRATQHTVIGTWHATGLIDRLHQP